MTATDVRYATVDGGRIAYLDAGDGPPVLLFHGFPDLPTGFAPLARLLGEAGYRTISPWLRGFWPSEPREFYDVGSLVADAIGVSEHLDLQRAHVIGHDWGADIAYGLSGARPDLVGATAVLGVPHTCALGPNRRRSFEQLRLSFYMWLFQLDGLAEEIVERNDFDFLARLWREWSPGWEPPAEHLASIRECFGHPGVVAAALGLYRAAFGTARSDSRHHRLRMAAEGEIVVPTLLLLGEHDRCLLPEMADGAEAAFSREYRAETLAGCGHFLHIERPSEVADRILAWFARSPIDTDARAPTETPRCTR
jgi:pimeloyl-ACP methyl ester carboxylesterase